MLTVNDLRKILDNYSDDTEIVNANGEEIKHIGMVFPHNKEKHVLVIASEKPILCCNKCGQNVYFIRDKGRWFCHGCQEEKSSKELSKIKNE